MKDDLAQRTREKTIIEQSLKKRGQELKKSRNQCLVMIFVLMLVIVVLFCALFYIWVMMEEIKGLEE